MQIITDQERSMDNVNRTMYIPLYGKAYVSKKGILLKDKKAEEIWEKCGFSLKGKSASKWLAYNMGMRAKVFDLWTQRKMREYPDAIVMHIGCGLDSRAQRIDRKGQLWYDIDFPAVIDERRKFFQEEEGYHMLPADMRQAQWKSSISGKQAVVVMEGVSMYFRPEELIALLEQLGTHFQEVALLMDCYTDFAAKATKYKNPINDVGVTNVYAMDDPLELARKTGYIYVSEHSLTPETMIVQLKRWERGIFRSLFAGPLAGKIYRLYEFQK